MVRAGMGTALLPRLAILSRDTRADKSSPSTSSSLRSRHARTSRSGKRDAPVPLAARATRSPSTAAKIAEDKKTAQRAQQVTDR